MSFTTKLWWIRLFFLFENWPHGSVLTIVDVLKLQKYPIFINFKFIIDFEVFQASKY